MKYYFELTFLAAIWGGSFLFLRISSPEFGPVPLIFVRTLISSLVFLPFLLKGKQYLVLRQYWLTFLYIGLISTAIPFSLFAYSTLHLAVGHTAILNATTPFFSAMIAYFFLNERLSLIASIGLGIGFVGVYFLAAFGIKHDTGIVLFPVLAALIAAFFYAVSSVYTRLRLSGIAPLVVAAGGQISSAFLLFPFALYLWPESSPSSLAWLSTLLMGVFSTALALIIFFRILQREGVSKAIAVTYLIPLFGSLWGWMFLDEAINTSMLLGGVLILLGVAMTTGLFKSSLEVTVFLNKIRR